MSRPTSRRYRPKQQASRLDEDWLSFHDLSAIIYYATGMIMDTLALRDMLRASWAPQVRTERRWAWVLTRRQCTHVSREDAQAIVEAVRARLERERRLTQLVLPGIENSGEEGTAM